MFDPDFKTSEDTGRKQLWLCVPLFLYLFALNPYLAPATYDNLIYWEGARSMVADGSYAIHDTPIRDWPPLFSVVLAIPMLLGLTHVIVAKLIVLACVFSGVYLAYATLQRYGYPYPLWSAILFALLPSSLLWGSRVMTEWPYIALSLGFLWLLPQWKSRRGSVELGFLLAAILLTRYVGITLIPAMAYVGWRRWREPVVVVGLGMGLFACAWGWSFFGAVQATEQESYYSGMGILSKLEPWVLLLQIPDLLFYHHLWSHGTGATVFALVVLLTTAVGLIRRLKSHGVGAVEVYIAAMLALLVVKNGKWLRYLLPLAPFLIAYFLEGGATLLRRFPRTRQAALAAWVALLLLYNSTLLVLGNMRDYGGLSPFISRTADEFYKGYWKDLYTACRVAAESDVEGPIAASQLGDKKYIATFSERIPVSIHEPAVFTLLRKPARAAEDLDLVDENAHFVLMKSPRG